jgi:hypothetical protein
MPDHGEFADSVLQDIVQGASPESPLSFTPKLDKSRNAAHAIVAILCQRLRNASSSEPTQRQATTFTWNGGLVNSRNIADRQDFWTNIRKSVADELHRSADNAPVVYLMTCCAPHEATFHVWALPEPIVYASLAYLPAKKSSEVQYNFEINPAKQRIERFSNGPDLTSYYRRHEFTPLEMTWLDRARAVDQAVKLERKATLPRNKVRSASNTALAQASESIENAPEDSSFLSANIIDARVRTFASIVRRSGQQQFRDRLLKAYDSRCAFSECTVESVLDAAHIIPYRGPHTDHPANGILLRTDLHTLFDLRLVTVDVASWRILLSPQLEGSSYSEFHGRSVYLPSISRLWPSKEALNQHRLETGL